MKPNKRFTFKSYRRLNLKRSTIIIALLLGIFTSVCLYMFQYAMFEALRMTSLVKQLDFVFLNDAVRHRNNLYMAGFATVFGHSAALAYLLKVGYLGQTKRKYLLRFTVHNQQGLSWYTLLWMTSFLWLLTMFFFSVFGMATVNIPSVFFNLLVVLALVVLFLHSYVGLRRLFRSNMHRWMAVSFLAILFIGFPLSRWHPIDTKTNDTLVKNAYPILQNPLEYPVIESGKRLDKKSWCNFLYVQQNSISDSLILFADGHEINASDIKQYITLKQNEHPESVRSYITTVLSADKNIPMFQINLVNSEVLQTLSAHLGFAVNDSIRLSKNLNKVFRIHYPTGPISHYLRDSITQNDLVILGHDKWLLNDVELSSDQLLVELSNRMFTVNESYSLLYDSTISLDDYLQTFDLYARVIMKKRNKVARSVFHMDFKDLSHKKKKGLSETCPWALFDFRFCDKH